MKLTRRVLLTAAFLLLIVLMISATEKYYDLLYLFYPSFCREALGYLAGWAAKYDYVVWQRIFLVLIAIIIISLIVQILRHKNVLHWFFSWTALLSFFGVLYMGIWGMNLFAPGINEDMRLEVEGSYSTQQLQEAAQYYLESANEYATQVSRDENGVFAPSEFDTLAAEVDSGFRTMTRTCYVFGGSTEPPKELGWSGIMKLFGIEGTMVCFTGEACVNPKLVPIGLPFEMSKQVARRMSIADDDDSSFAAILTCMASSSKDYVYSGYAMAYSYCYAALLEANGSQAAKLTQDVSSDLRTDLVANGLLEDSSAADTSYMTLDCTPSNADNTVAELLVAWYIYQTTPQEEETEETDPATAPDPENITSQQEDAA